MNSSANTLRPDTGLRHRAKYSNRNPLHRWTLGRFFSQFADEIRVIAPKRTLEFGCGEGLLLHALKQEGIHFPLLHGLDIRQEAITQAQELLPEYQFFAQDLFCFQPEASYDLVICSQTLEHLIDPNKFLAKLRHLSSGLLLLSVPWEPWFQIMNLARGRDLLRLGNHPEHIQHWTFRGFQRFVEQGELRIRHAKHVFPFTIVLAEIGA